MMRNSIKNRMNTGGALVILVILVVAMSLFAVLAIQSSLNEKKLSLKTKEGIENYYMLDAEAERVYARIDGIVVKSKDIVRELNEYKEFRTATADGAVKVEISDIQYEGEFPTLVKYSVVQGEKSLNVEVGVIGRETTVNRWSTKTKSDNLEYELEITD
ncbi:MAG: pilus assembly PilX N-terminal domain-containing protein [Catonella sp.]|uniref:pilus assembly PilX N-terminal domain-containing protein n=1 Tax=Catonella sp. TaxID=2382125 RepID=UPI003F9F4FC3